MRRTDKRHLTLAAAPQTKQFEEVKFFVMLGTQLYSHLARWRVGEGFRNSSKNTHRISIP